LVAFTISSAPSNGKTPLSVTELKVGATSGLVAIWTSKTLTVGFHTVTVTATLNSAVISDVTISLEVEPCVVTSFVMAPFNPSTYTYNIANTPLAWSLTPITI
jgi:hypothetical protein